MKKIPYLVWVKILIATGIAIRVYQYLVGRSLYHDEALLARNVNELTFSELAGVLEYHQAAPVGLLWLTKIVVSILGNHEFAFRVVPLLAGIGSIFLFHKLLRHFLKPPFSIFALAFFVFNGYHIFYAISFKQYGIDVFIGLIISIAFLKVFFGQKEENRIDLRQTNIDAFIWKATILALSSSLLIFFSQPLIFILSGCTLATGIYLFRTREYKGLQVLIGTSFLWGAAFLLYYFFLIKPNISNSMLQNFHEPYFMPSTFWKVDSWSWLMESFLRIYKNPGDIHFKTIGAVIAFVGILWGLVNEKEKWLLLLFPILLAFGASALGKYSTLGRLILFATPALVIFLVKGLEFIYEKLKDQSRLAQPVIFCLAALLLLQSFLNSAIHNTFKPARIEDIKTLLGFIENQKKERDVLYVYFAAEPQFGYYKEKYDFKDMEVMLGKNPNAPEWKEDFEQLKGKSRVWVLMTHFKRLDGKIDNSLYTEKMETFCSKILEKTSQGGLCFLYDCSQKK